MIEQLLQHAEENKPYIVVVSKKFDYEWVAYQFNKFERQGIQIKGVIVQKDDGVLIHNRLQMKVPIVDEVAMIDKVPIGKKAAIEVAPPGHVIRMLSNPYGLSTAFDLTPKKRNK